MGCGFTSSWLEGGISLLRANYNSDQNPSYLCQICLRKTMRFTIQLLRPHFFVDLGAFPLSVSSLSHDHCGKGLCICSLSLLSSLSLWKRPLYLFSVSSVIPITWSLWKRPLYLFSVSSVIPITWSLWKRPLYLFSLSLLSSLSHDHYGKGLCIYSLSLLSSLSHDQYGKGLCICSLSPLSSLSHDQYLLVTLSLPARISCLLSQVTANVTLSQSYFWVTISDSCLHLMTLM